MINGARATAESWLVETLPGGLRVVVESLPYVRSVSVGVWVGVGSRHEPPALAGMSHLVEHLVFKGTARRSARRIAEEMDSMGGHLNGYTCREYTCYYVKVLDEHLERAVDLLADLVQNPRNDPEDLAKEKGVILEEIKMYEDTPDELAADLLAEAIWGQDALGRPVLGSAQTVSEASIEATAGFFAEHYRQGATVLALAGNVTPERAFALARDHFGAMPAGGGARGPGSPRFHAEDRLRCKDIEQANLCLGFDGVRLAAPEVYDFHLLAGVLGGSSSSRLFQSIREDRGLAYSVYAYASPFSDGGFFGIFTGVSPQNVLPVVRLIGVEARDLCRRGPTPDELQRAKDQVKASMLLGLESTSERMSRLGRSLLLLDQIITPDELARRVDAVTGDSLLAMARATLDPTRFALSAVGPQGLVAPARIREALVDGWEGR